MARDRSKPPDVFARQGFEAFVLGLPATILVRQWGDSSVAKVGGKIFAIFGGGAAGDPAAISFKCSDIAFDMLRESRGIRPAPYLARARWVAVNADSALNKADAARYVAEAHRLVAAKLPRRLKAALGLDGSSAAAPDRP